MFQNFIRIAIRNILRHKGFTFINIAGLSVGIAASLLILLWVQDEFTYENYCQNGKDIYRVEEDQFYSGSRYHVSVTPFPSGPVWKAKIPEIKDQARIMPWMPRFLFRQADKAFFESSVASADSGFIKMFTLPMEIGDPVTILNSPHSIVLTRKLATKYFGKENPIGKTISLENKYQFMVTGVMKDLPKNSIFYFEALIPFSFLKEAGIMDYSWGDNSIFTFVQLEKNTDKGAVNKKLTDIVKENNQQSTTKFVVFPLLDIHLHGQFGFTESRGPIIIVYLFTLIAIFVLLIACINFINLSTARAARRSKEIGIKKVSGADQLSMMIQFMGESLMLVAVAMVFSLILVGLFLSTFNNIAGKGFTLENLLSWKFILGYLLVGIVAGVVSGIYPAFYLSSIKPVLVLKGDKFTGNSNSRLRQILVITQFSLSILIAVASVVSYMQLRYMKEKDLGFNKENVICIPMADNMKSKYYSLKKEFQKETLIKGVTASTWNPVNIGSNSGGASWEGKDPDKQVLIGTDGVDYDYLSTLGVKLVSGRDFSRDYPSDMAHDTTGNFLVNEEVVKIMGIGDPVGKGFRFMGLNGKIIGVMKNFHFQGVDQPIQPLAFALSDMNYLRVILVRLDPSDIPASLKSVGKIWKDVIPEYPLQYSFIDQDYDYLFRTQIRMTSLLKYFTILAVIVACLGLYALSAYSAERRTNEVGIRKVMGAGSFSVMYSMAKEFLTPVIISIIIAIPAGWIIVGNMLKQFPYRIHLNILIFLAIAAGALVIAMLTVSFQAYKASVTNPAEALKVE